MRSDQTELRERLDEVDIALGELYERAVGLLNEAHSVARLTLLAHSVREIANEFSAAMALADGTVLASRVDLDSPPRELVKIWDEFGLSDEPGYEEEFRPIPGPVYKAAALVVESQRKATWNSEFLRSQTVGALIDTDNPTSRQLRSAVAFFESYVHLPRARTRSLPSDEQIHRAFSVVETTIFSRLAPFFDVAADLSDILDEANRLEPRTEVDSD